MDGNRSWAVAKEIPNNCIGVGYAWGNLSVCDGLSGQLCHILPIAVERTDEYAI